MPEFIPSTDLRLEHAPLSTANIHDISRFAITFNADEVGKEAWTLNLDSDFSTLSLVELRCILYVEQRRWNHYHRAYTPEVEAKLREIVERIRGLL
ncbi:MAG: hypothetical protein SF052_14275 [Bacteroidia bacterium]|nr:hypothetical protein [Bacteroidia bacterium]